MRLELSLEAVKENLICFDQITRSMLNMIETVDTKRTHFAIHEIVMNSIQSGEKQGIFGLIDLVMYTDTEVLIIKVKDRFGGCEIDQSIKDVSVLEERGRGLFLVQQMVDSFDSSLDKNGTFIVEIRQKLGGKNENH